MPAVGSSSSSSFGRVAERAGDLEAALVAVRQVACPGVRPSLEPDELEQLVPALDRLASSSAWLRGVRRIASHQRLLAGGRGWPTRTLSRADIVPNSRMFWNVRPMPSAVTWCGLSDRTLVPFVVTIVVAVERDLAAGRHVGAGDHVEERRLAGAVRADERDDRRRAGCRSRRR